MRNILEKFEPGQVLKLIPDDVEYSTRAKVLDMLDKNFRLELMREDQAGYIPGSGVEVFTTTSDGLLYFETTIEEVDGKKLTASMPHNHKYLQRREYTRVFVNEPIKLDKTQNVRMTDISAGGMKVFSKSQLELDKDYKVDLFIGKKEPICAEFQPIRMDVEETGGYTISGRFKKLKNIDRISLVQFCFKKQIENQNK